jgi:hypothetical protein
MVRELLAEGWSLKAGRHLKLLPPWGNEFITISRTPSDYRDIKNIRAIIRRLVRSLRSEFPEPD